MMGQSVYYGLYGMERIGALTGRKTISGIDWYDRGRSFILGSQEATGAAGMRNMAIFLTRRGPSCS